MEIPRLFLEKKMVPFIFIYILTLLLIYVTITFSRTNKNSLFLTFIISFAFIILFFLIRLYERLTRIPLIKGKTTLRYTMLCHKCGWEWMSHTTDKENPKKCPNCNEKSHLETIGWRKVSIPQKKVHRDLRKFFK